MDKNTDSLEHILDRLSFTEGEVISASLEQPRLYMSAATFRIKKMGVRQRAETAVENARVDLGLKLRAKAIASGEKLPTEGYLNDMVEGHTSVRQAALKLDEAKRAEKWAELLLDAMEHRRSALKVVSQLAFLSGSSPEVERQTESLESMKERLRKARSAALNEDQ